MIKKYWSVLAFTVLFAGITPLLGQNKPLDNSEVFTLKKGEVQFDLYGALRDAGDGNDRRVNGAVRYAAFDNIELQVSWTGNDIKLFGLDAYSSNQFARVGAKFYLLKETTYLPGLSAIVSSNLTTNTDNLAFNPAIEILYDKTFGNFRVNGTANFAHLDGINQEVLSFGINLEAAVTEWFDGYVGYIHTDNAILPNWTHLEIGTFWWLKSGLRLYPYYDLGLNDNTPDVMNLGLLLSL